MIDCVGRFNITVTLRDDPSTPFVFEGVEHYQLTATQDYKSGMASPRVLYVYVHPDEWVAFPLTSVMYYRVVDRTPKEDE